MSLQTVENTLKHIRAFLLGMWEFRRSYTWADPARTQHNNYTDLDEACDRGRAWAHVLTLRLFDQ